MLKSSHVDLFVTSRAFDVVNGIATATIVTMHVFFDIAWHILQGCSAIATDSFLDYTMVRISFDYFDSHSLTPNSGAAFLMPGGI
jgi:hypothetical protein